MLCCDVCPTYNLLLPGRGIRTASNRPGTTPSPSRGPLGPVEPQPARHCFVTGPVLSVARTSPVPVALPTWRPSPSSTYYLLLLLPCFSNLCRLSPNFLPNLKKVNVKKIWNLKLLFQILILGFRIINVKNWDLVL